MAVWAVVHSLPFFVLDHILLIGEGGLGNGVDQVAHPVRLQPKGQLKGILGHNLIIDGSVRVGPPVQATPGSLYFLEELVLAHVFRLLEHHMLEEVGKSGTAGFFPVGTHMILNGH